MIWKILKKEEPLTVDSFDKSLVEKVRMIDDLEETQKNHIYAIIDMAISNTRLKSTLTNAYIYIKAPIGAFCSLFRNITYKNIIFIFIK